MMIGQTTSAAVLTPQTTKHRVSGSELAEHQVTPLVRDGLTPQTAYLFESNSRSVRSAHDGVNVL